MQSNNQNGFRFFLKEVSLFSFTCILKHSCLQKNKQIQFCEKAGSYMKIRMLLQKKFQFHYGKCLAYMPSSLTQWSQLISEGALNTCTSVFTRYSFDSYKVQRADLTCHVTSIRLRWFEPWPIRDEYSNFAGAYCWSHRSFFLNYDSI